MPTQQELELLALAAQQRVQNKSSRVTQTADLPDLPAWTHTRIAREVVAAEVQGIAAMSEESYLRDLWDTPAPSVTEVAVGNLRRDIERVADSEAVAAIGAALRPSSTVEAALAGEASVAELQGLWGVPDGAVATYEDFELGGDPLPGGGIPNERVRFQMGREAPRRQPFYSAPPVRTNDGSVVSQRGADGRFRATQRPVTATARPSPAQQIQPSPPKGPGPSRYQRLMQPSVFDGLVED